jgi:RNA polymerase sigma-70 factor (ECF subfamily)
VPESDQPKHGQVWQPFVAGVRMFVAKRVPPSDVDDVVQDILIRAHQSVSELRNHNPAEAWVFGIAGRALADFYRKRERNPSVGSTDEISIAALLPPQNLAFYQGEHDVHEEVLSWLRPMADELREPYRSAVLKSDFEQIKQRELAKELGLSESGLKSRVQRGRAMLADILRRCCEVEFGNEGRAVAFRRMGDCSCDH